MTKGYILKFIDAIMHQLFDGVLNSFRTDISQVCVESLLLKIYWNTK